MKRVRKNQATNLIGQNLTRNLIPRPVDSIWMSVLLDVIRTCMIIRAHSGRKGSCFSNLFTSILSFQIILVSLIMKQNTLKTMLFSQFSSEILSFFGSLLFKFDKSERSFKIAQQHSVSHFRLDIEEGLAEEKKVRDTLNKELEALQKKAKIIDIGVKNAESELEAFQVIFATLKKDK